MLFGEQTTHRNEQGKEKLTRRMNDQVDVENDRVIKKAVNPHPPRPIRNGLVDRELPLARLRHVIALAPEIELVNSDDEKNADDQLYDPVGQLHKVSLALKV